MEIKIVTRDINGKRDYLEACSFEGAHEGLTGLTDEDEIQLVTIDGNCLFHGLMGGYLPLDEAVGFFA